MATSNAHTAVTNAPPATPLPFDFERGVAGGRGGGTALAGVEAGAAAGAAAVAAAFVVAAVEEVAGLGSWGSGVIAVMVVSSGAEAQCRAQTVAEPVNALNASVGTPNP